MAPLCNTPLLCRSRAIHLNTNRARSRRIACTLLSLRNVHMHANHARSIVSGSVRMPACNLDSPCMLRMYAHHALTTVSGSGSMEACTLDSNCCSSRAFCSWNASSLSRARCPIISVPGGRLAVKKGSCMHNPVTYATKLAKTRSGKRKHIS